ncbi:MurR/RpiR family transcriptional regulator [Sporosarcina koreensis]|uniref:MurR/RpiR family transcriptional regulator n=1 Tax=Sporosarcina koreensis TaxID=334735 RepID=A0ABW0U3G8_9BACL
MNIEDIIKSKYEKLSAGQKKIAEYLLNNKIEYGMSTAAQLARKVDVSETTIIRLSYALGFDSFTHMQKELQKQFLEDGERLSNSQQYQSSDDAKGGLFQSIIERDISILQNMSNNLNEMLLWQTADILMEADEVKIAGFRASYTSAHWFYLKLSMMRENVNLINSASHSFPEHLLFNQDKKNVIVLLSFPSYVAETLRIAEIAKKQGVTVIAITDRVLSSVGRIADVCLTTDINVASENLISVSSVLSLLNLVTAAIESKYDKKVSDRVKKITQMHANNNYFLE